MDHRMVAIVIPHFDYPFSLDAHGRAVLVDQGTTDEIAACVAVAISTPLGQRLGRPEFGSPDMAFTGPNGVATAIASVAQSEPRAQLAVQDDMALVDGVTRRVRVEVRA